MASRQEAYIGTGGEEGSGVVNSGRRRRRSRKRQGRLGIMPAKGKVPSTIEQRSNVHLPMSLLISLKDKLLR